MKLTITYDLIDKIKEANDGYSLKRCLKRGTSLVGINSIIGLPINLCAGSPPEKYFTDLLIYIGIHTITTGLPAVMLKESTKRLSKWDLYDLSQRLKDINVNVTMDNLLDAYQYKTEYEPNLKGQILEQKKYIHVPVNDYWGEREISLCQEHIVGSKDWALSIGTPKEAKVYTLGMNKAINK